MADSTDRTLASELESREVAEAAREAEWSQRSFSKRLFNGRLAVDLLQGLPNQDPDEQERARPFLEKLEAFAAEHIDGDAIDRDGWVPQEVLDGLAELGAFGIKIPREYGGLGLSQVTYNKALEIVASRCGSTGAFLSAHQSIGVPGPLMMFGTEEQKQRFLPRLASGALSAFALTEPDAGSDPANMTTRAEISGDGEHWILNGEKLWCTNGPRADIIVVMARTPPREGVRGRRPVSAFIVETDSPGVEVKHTSSFMGLRGLSNGVLTFTDVEVPKENLIWGEGRGLKLALVTLNVGRLSLPAFCAASAKASLEMSRDWAGKRVQWGQPVGRHDAVAQKLGLMAADTFALDSVVAITSSMADSKQFDIRLEAAFAKMWNTERAWELANDALQIRGGRGYETHESLVERGETPYPIERMVRDLRINLIFEGSSEIMRLFIAREAVDDHFSVAGDLVDPKASLGAKLKAVVKAGFHYAWWFPTRFVGWGHWPRYGSYGALATHLRYADRTARRLTRSIFYAMLRFGPGLEKRQAVLGRLVEIGAELFVMTATCVRADRLARGGGDASARTLADVFCRHARRRIEARFDRLFDNDDTVTYQVAKDAMAGRFSWVERGIVSMTEAYGTARRTPAPPKGRGAGPAPSEPAGAGEGVDGSQPREREPAGAD